MEDDLNFWQMEDNLNILANGRRPKYFGKMEDDLNIVRNKRLPQYFDKWKATPIFCQIEDKINFWKMKGNLIILEYGIRPQYLVNGR